MSFEEGATVASAADAVGDDRRHFAHAVARDLFDYMSSVEKGSSSATPGMLLVPEGILDRWITRFDGKFAREGPAFLFKGQR